MVMPFSSVLSEPISERKVVDGSNVWNSTIAPVHTKPAIAPNATLIQ